MDNQPSTREESSAKKNVLFEVTTLSKVLAGLIFIAMPFIGGWIGYNYSPVKIVEIERVIIKEQAPVVTNIVKEPTEQYFGVVGDDSIVFEHIDYTSYTLIKNGTLTSGELNTERGFEEDIDATVYVLNWMQPEPEQLYFVRLTKDDTQVHQLDSNRKLIPEAILEKAQPTALFSCLNSSYIKASFSSNYVWLNLSDKRELLLPQVISASGARYANNDESFVFWNKGDTAFITENENNTYSDCSTSTN